MYIPPVAVTLARVKTWLAESFDPDARVFWIGWLILLPMFLAPLYVTRFLPGLDLPFHLSIADMLDKYGRASSPYGSFYEGARQIAPYALHYMGLWFFGKFMPLLLAHKLIIALYVVGMPASAAALLGACGRSRIPALVAYPLAYNLTLHYGFVSFALSLPVLLWMLALLAKFLIRDAVSWRVWGGTATMALLLFLCHLQNFLYGVCAFLTFLIFAGVPWRRRLVGLAALAPAAAALSFWQFTADFVADPLKQKKTLSYTLSVLKWERLSDLDGGRVTIAEDLKKRLVELPYHVLRGFTDYVDVQACYALGLVLAAYFVLGVVGLWAPRDPHNPPRMRTAGVVLFFGATAAFFGLPHHLHVFELMTFYPRFSVLVAVMLLMLIPSGLRNLGGMMRVWIAAPAVLVCGFYGQVLIDHYKQYADELKDFATVMDALPPGGRTLGLMFDRTSRVMRIESALVGLPNLYPVVHPSANAMTPLAYCGMRHMPCRRKDPAGALPEPGAWEPQHLTADMVPYYDYFIVRSRPPGYLFGSALSMIEQVSFSPGNGAWWALKRKSSVPRKEPPPPAPPPAPAPKVAARPPAPQPAPDAPGQLPAKTN